jgi:hypothetical protein
MMRMPCSTNRAAAAFWWFVSIWFEAYCSKNKNQEKSKKVRDYSLTF